MDYMRVREKGPQKKRGLLHWVVAAAFLVMVITGLIMFVPSFSSLAAGGWTRLIHRSAAVVLIGAPILYALINSTAALSWLEEALFWRRKTSANAPNTWKTIHKSLIAVGFIIFALTGMIQWFLKGVVPNQVFQWSLSFHDIIFFAAILILLYHLYYEVNWWLWKRRYCRNCSQAYCVDACPTGALTHGPDGSVEYYPRRCNSCRLCLEYCQRSSYHKKVDELERIGSSR
ncbi:MAG TPA: hypothetical protein G4O13_00210 [Dehalococcoidia bacterium]|nr:hypothetical protein [Dehalococcoidia bacterium]